MGNREKEIQIEIDKNGCHNCISHSKNKEYPQIQRNKIL